MSRPAAGNPLMPPRAPGKASERVVQRRPKHVGPSLWNAISRAATGWTVCAAALGNLRAAHGHPFGAAASRPTASLFPNVYVLESVVLGTIPNTKGLSIFIDEMQKSVRYGEIKPVIGDRLLEAAAYTLSLLPNH